MFLLVKITKEPDETDKTEETKKNTILQGHQRALFHIFLATLKFKRRITHHDKVIKNNSFSI